MATMDEYVLRYHHGGTLVKEGHVSYIDGSVAEFAVDPDKLCYWDLLGDLKELGYDIKKSVTLYFIDGDGVLKPIFDDKGTITLVDQLRKQWVVEIYVECSGVDHDISMPEILRNATDIDKDLGVMKDKSGDSESESCEDFEERLVDVPFINYSSDSDEERKQARENVSKYIQLKKSIQDNADESDNEDGDKERSIDSAGCHVGTSDAVHVNEDGKVPGYESEYIESSYPGSYMDTSDSDASDARRHKSSKMYYDPSVPLVDFSLDLRFDDLKMFKKKLVEFSTRKGFEFKYIKNDSVRVRAKCSAKGCTWFILCSWCSGKKRYVVKHYEPNHSCLLGTSKNKRVTAHTIARKFGDVLSSMPFIRPRHLKTLVRRELGVFITDKVCRNSKAFVVKKVEQQFKDDFMVLNNYAMELKATNPGSSVLVISERQSPSELPTFQKIYICLSAVKEGFIAGCRKVIGIDGCFLKGLLKGQLLVAVRRDGNNQMFPIAWAIVDKKTTRSCTWFLENLNTDLGIEDGLGWALISDMQKGLIHAVNSLFPLIEHRMCARHIYARWGKQHPSKDLQLQFWNIARSPNQPEMQKQLESMRKVSLQTFQHNKVWQLLQLKKMFNFAAKMHVATAVAEENV